MVCVSEKLKRNVNVNVNIYVNVKTHRQSVEQELMRQLFCVTVVPKLSFQRVSALNFLIADDARLEVWRLLCCENVTEATCSPVGDDCFVSQQTYDVLKKLR